MRKPIILIPEKLHILRERKNQTIRTNREEYNIYFENLLFPYLPDYDVQINCKYGRNLGNCWRLDEFPDVDEFRLGIEIYDSFTGELLAEKEVSLTLHESRQNEKPFTLLPIGDSMTQSEIYLEHIAMKLRNLSFVGTRSFNGIVRHEGRGGWASSTYFENSGNRWGMSPFLFPDGIEPEDYYGYLDFMEKAGCEVNPDTYVYDGYTHEDISGRVYLKDSKLFRRSADGEIIVDESPRFRFDFGAYMRRYRIKKPDAVSILLGCNDLASTGRYDNFEEILERLVENLKAMADSIRSAIPDVKLLIMTPIFGGSQYAWGQSRACGGSSAMYRHIISHTIKRLIDEFGSREEDGYFIVPSHLTIDPVYGYKNETRRANIYSEHQIFVNTDGIHPNPAGYRQMGDALAGVIEKIRGESI